MNYRCPKCGMSLDLPLYECFNDGCSWIPSILEQHIMWRDFREELKKKEIEKDKNPYSKTNKSAQR